MVMETPSAQCVGREFVRQYYTLLHEAPHYLHRFYSHNSCFVHGGVEKPGEEQPPVMGQNEIHEKIVSLKFVDCHAKIRQVDSQPTVSNAVVVQVTGELSNAGAPMRRFMQTFVLAPQSPKKYYVHNDIFRYQDEVFHDIDADAEDSAVECEAELEVHESAPEMADAMPEQNAYYEPASPPQPMSNGLDDEETEEQELPVEEEEEEEEVNLVEEPQSPEPAEEPAAVYTEELKEPEPVIPAEPEPQPEPQPPVPEAPKSWAARAALANQRPPVAQPVTATKPAPVKPVAPAPATTSGDQSRQNDGKPQRAPRAPRSERPGPGRDSSRGQSSGGPADSVDDSGRPGRVGPPGPNRQKDYPDNQQVFVGNLPHELTDQELQKFFEEYGKVADVRINRKSAQNHKETPNFGFVVFAAPESVEKVLSNKPIIIHGPAGDIRANVERKMNKSDQMGGGGGRPGSGNRMGGGGRGGGPGMGGGRGGSGGPRGGSRGGMGSGRGDRGRSDGGPPRGGGFGRPR